MTKRRDSGEADPVMNRRAFLRSLMGAAVALPAAAAAPSLFRTSHPLTAACTSACNNITREPLTLAALQAALDQLEKMMNCKMRVTESTPRFLFVPRDAENHFRRLYMGEAWHGLPPEGV